MGLKKSKPESLLLDGGNYQVFTKEIAAYTHKCKRVKDDTVCIARVEWRPDSVSLERLQEFPHDNILK